ncbi:MAG: phospholipase [Gemmatimonadetes bacterium]|nr:phospholipase [Gemmatimonadota bacterium]NIV81418.1 phospholipase [Gemmatimonadota bacterium]NIY38118.1 phospholipase [Gemmatimonadota bacterium]
MSGGAATDEPASRESPHRGRPVLRRGAAPEAAEAAALLLHGRGGSARGMLALADEARVPRVAFLAPRAADHTWYPERFLAPLERNEPWLGSALELLDEVLSELAGAGVSRERTVLIGFSQGACLALEYAARRGGRYGGVAALSGGLIGPPGRSWDHGSSLGGTPVFLGCSDRDPHIPEERVHESGRVLESLGANVRVEIYPGLGHTVNGEEIEAVRGMLEVAAAA